MTSHLLAVQNMMCWSPLSGGHFSHYSKNIKREKKGIRWIIGFKEIYYVGDDVFLEVLHRNRVFGLPTTGREIQFLHQKETKKSKTLPKRLRDLGD